MPRAGRSSRPLPRDRTAAGSAPSSARRWNTESSMPTDLPYFLITDVSMPTHPSCRRTFCVLLASALLAASAPGLAHGPTRQKVSEKVTIEAPADAVWAKVKNFNALKDWHPAVAESPSDK